MPLELLVKCYCSSADLSPAEKRGSIIEIQRHILVKIEHLINFQYRMDVQTLVMVMEIVFIHFGVTSSKARAYISPFLRLDFE